MRGKTKRPQSAENTQTQSGLKKLSVGDAANRNDKIMTALDKLGQKFVESEADRMIIKKNLDENFNSQREIERKFKRQSAQSEKIESRLNEVLQENERLRQKIEESEKKRVRMLKRIERVENIANEAQTALEAKAIVLLTDQAIARQTGLPQIEAAGAAASGIYDPLEMGIAAPRAAGKGGDFGPDLSFEPGQNWWNGAFRLRASVAGLALVAALLAGWVMKSAFTPTPQTAFAIMQDGRLARVDLATGEITPVIMDMAKVAEAAKQPAQATATATEATSQPVATDDPAAIEAATAAALKATNQPPLTERIKPDESLSRQLKELEKKAFEGNAEAQHDLAALYTAGQGVKQDYLRAAAWFREAAAGNVANASYNLGVLYHQGLGVKQDMTHALDWYRRAALLGHPEAQYNLGIAYIEGSGAPYNPNLAAAFFQQSALNGIVEGAYNLGLILENGLLGQAHLEQAMLWYRAAADKGNNEAQLALSSLADKLGADKATAGLLAGGTGLAASMRAANDMQPQNAGFSGVELPKSDKIDVALADFVPQQQQMILAEIQGQLSRLSLYSGPQDGLMGPRTTEAIKTYQTIQGLEIDGVPTDSLLAFMLAQATQTAAE